MSRALSVRGSRPCVTSQRMPSTRAPITGIVLRASHTCYGPRLRGQREAATGPDSSPIFGDYLGQCLQRTTRSRPRGRQHRCRHQAKQEAHSISSKLPDDPAVSARSVRQNSRLNYVCFFPHRRRGYEAGIGLERNRHASRTGPAELLAQGYLLLVRQPNYPRARLLARQSLCRHPEGNPSR